MPKPSSLLFSFLLFFSLSSCSSQLTYQNKEINIDHHAAISSSSPQYSIIILENAKDLRVNPDKLGEIRHESGTLLGKITTKQNIPNFFNTALKSELKNAGFKVVERSQMNENSIPENALVIQQQILHLSAHPPKEDPTSTRIVQGDIIVDLSIKQGHREADSILLKGTERVFTRQASPNLEKEAIEAAFSRYFSEIVELLLNTSRQIALKQKKDKSQVSIKR